jgi:biopolymer transport protein ExbD
MSQPTAMKLFLPKDTEKQDELNKVKESGALTIMLGKGDGVYYYEGQLAQDASNFKSSNFKDIRDVIINKKKSTNPEDFVVVIKPGPEATYKNTVDILDEMTINDVKRYAMVDIFPTEVDLMHATEASGGIK